MMDRIDALVDTVLIYLEAFLPQPLYSALFSTVSHVFTLTTDALRLLLSLILQHPSQWDIQTFLPPMFTLLAAYLALLSLYRTASWAVRLAAFFVKWLFIIGVLSVGTGWLAAMTNMNENNALVDLMKGWTDARAGSTARGYHRSTEGRGQHRTSSKPQGHSADWQYDAAQAQGYGNSDAQTVMQNIVDTAAQMMDGSAWVRLSSILAGTQQSSESREEEGKGKAKSR